MLSQTADKKQYIGHILQNIPHRPGVYKMKDVNGTVIYIGKAVDLKNRVSSYFKNAPKQEARTRKMVEQVADIDYTVVGSDLEALMLETNLIKEIRPKYNVLMKDDKNYVYLKVTVGEEYPRIYLVRKVARDKARYFGPKTAAWKVVSALKLLKRIFPYRNCQLAMDYGVRGEEKYKNMTPSQLEYHRKHCLGPCITSVSPDEYGKTVREVINFFEGKNDGIIKMIKEDMMRAASEKKFEVAASIRDKLRAIEDINAGQRVSDPALRDLDIVNYAGLDEKAYFVLFQVRGGKLIGQENFTCSAKETGKNSTEDREALSSFLEQYYEKAADIPPEVLVPHEIEDTEIIEKWLTNLKGQNVKIRVPGRGKKNHLLELTLQNAQSFARQSRVKWQGQNKDVREQALKDLQKLLKLKKTPLRMECYDISHFQGTETVGSMVVFEKGFPKNDDYRHFRLHCDKAGAPNDYASMQEILARRLKYLKPSAAAAQTRLRKPRKKEIPLILKPLAVKKLPRKTFLAVETDGEYSGFLEIAESPGKKALLEKFEFSREPDLAFLLRKTAEKVKVGRLHIAAPAALSGKFEEAGCQIVKKIPDHVKARTGERILVFDKVRQVEDTSFRKIPDLVIVDGGKGQLSCAMKIIDKYGLKTTLPLLAIAKKDEELFIPGKPHPVSVAKNDPVLNLVRHIRDESHRFAVSYHQKLRLKATTSSILDTIHGLGPGLKNKLLNRFGSPESIKTASEEELALITGPKIAKKLKNMI